MRFEFVTVDIQNEFATKGGKHYTSKPSVAFMKRTLFPYFRRHRIKVNEIISDYRQPRPGDTDESCRPGSWGYESLVPNELRKSLWIKCMNSPVWIRKNIGKKDATPGLPYPDPKAFNGWVQKNIGKPGEVTPVFFGLTIDCCVLSTVQEFRWRGYEPIIIREAVDHANGKIKDRDIVLAKSALRWWAKTMPWKEFVRFIERNI